jgi:hypothetical protein
MFDVVAALHAPKEGNSEEQYEDAFAFAESALPDRLTVAVSDGASSAGYAREWANRLVEAFATDTPFPENDATVLQRVAALGAEWRGAVSGGATSWYAQEKLASGSAATLLVATLDAASRQLSAACIGDVCLFVVRNDRLRFGFPVARAKGFGDRPDLLITEELGTRKPPRIHRFTTAIEPGDRLFFFTDALSHYFLSRFETKKERPWQSLPRTNEELADWLQKRRDRGDIKNDDVTLIEVRYRPTAA